MRLIIIVICLLLFASPVFAKKKIILTTPIVTTDTEVKLSVLRINWDLERAIIEVKIGDNGSGEIWKQNNSVTPTDFDDFVDSIKNGMETILLNAVAVEYPGTVE